MNMAKEYMFLALSSLRSNKMRALLTMLGIIIGIMAIITIVIIGDALTASVSSSLSSLGTNNITVSVQEKGTESSVFVRQGGEGTRTSASAKTPSSEDLLTDQMIENMMLNFPDAVAGIALSYSAGGAQAREGELYANISITGTNADYILANHITLLSGRFTSAADVKNKSQTVVVSDKFVKNMFPDGIDPIGREIKLYKTNSIEIFTIIGVYQYEQSGFGGSTVSEKDMTTSCYIPVSTAKQDLLEKNFNNLTVIGSAGYDVNELTASLQKYFDGVYLNNKDWKISVSNMTSMLDTITSTLSTISLAIAFIAGISLLVGGIGVMNIMLVSVTERTREIGTRKALGAKNFHIQFQFVMEAILISAVGGIIGLLLGIALGALVATIFGVPLVLSPLITAASVLFSMAIGVFFGIYPANKAAKLDPIEALRYE